MVKLQNAEYPCPPPPHKKKQNKTKQKNPHTVHLTPFKDLHCQ